MATSATGLQTATLGESGTENANTMQVTHLLKNQGHVLSIERVNLFSPPEASNQRGDMAGSSDHDRRMDLADSNAVTTTAAAAKSRAGGAATFSGTI